MHITGMTPDQTSVDKWEAQLRKGGLELAILAALWHESRYGLEVLRVLADNGLQVSEGTVYPLLNRLRREDLVSTEWVESRDGPPRKYYLLTPAGRERLGGMAIRWQSFNQSLTSLLEAVIKESGND